MTESRRRVYPVAPPLLRSHPSERGRFVLPAAVPHVLASLPEGVDGIRQTLKYMVKFARTYSHDLDVVTQARNILAAARVPEKDFSGEITALQNWVRDRIRYVRDPITAEMVQTPKRTLQVVTGDCDDKATLLAALLGSIGFATRFLAIGIDGGPYSHVLVEVRLGTRWIPLETILANAYPGWLPPNITRTMYAHV